MTCSIGINGFGRIGRMVLRRAMTLPDVEVVAINDRAQLGELVYLLKYDSVHGPFPGDVCEDGQAMRVNGKTIRCFAESEPAKIPWGLVGVDVVIEATGALRGRAAAAQHLQGDARKVLISAPSDVDAPCTSILDGTMAKILAWYDNEWGYACRLAELAGRL